MQTISTCYCFSCSRTTTIYRNIFKAIDMTIVLPLDQDRTIYSEDFDNVNVLNDLFCKLTIMLNDENVSHPELPLFDGVGLSYIVVTCDEVGSVLKTLPISKATGPDGIDNCILRELAHELSSPLWSFFNQSLILGIDLTFEKKHVCVLFQMVVIEQLFQTNVLSRC